MNYAENLYYLLAREIADNAPRHVSKWRRSNAIFACHHCCWLLHLASALYAEHHCFDMRAGINDFTLAMRGRRL